MLGSFLARGKSYMQEYFFWHFYSEGHEGFPKDLSVTLINKTYASDPKKRHLPLACIYFTGECSKFNLVCGAQARNQEDFRAGEFYWN